MHNYVPWDCNVRTRGHAPYRKFVGQLNFHDIPCGQVERHFYGFSGVHGV